PETQQLPGDVAFRELAGALSVLEANGAQARPSECPEVGPHRVDVLVDPELLLVLLLGVRAAPVRGARPLVDPGDDTAAPRYPSELGAHRRQIDGMVKRRHAERDVEASVCEWEPLAVGLDPQVPPRALLEEGAAPEADDRVGDEVAGDVLAPAREQVERGPA